MNTARPRELVQIGTIPFLSFILNILSTFRTLDYFFHGSLTILLLGTLFPHIDRATKEARYIGSNLILLLRRRIRADFKTRCCKIDMAFGEDLMLPGLETRCAHNRGTTLEMRKLMFVIFP